MQHRSPFKFLDSYNEEDKDFFFGRDEEIRKLYKYTKKNRVVVVYGPSGSGKTSTVRSGLAKMFDSINWLPIFIRREENINHAFLRSLVKKAGEAGLPEKYTGIIQQIRDISSYYLSPVYLVFEQFEELLLMGCEEEKSAFAATLRTLAGQAESFSCHIIIVMREEFFGLLDKFETEVPGLSDRRMRIEPMQEKDVKEVIKKTLNYEPFHVQLAENQDENIDLIYKALADKKGEVSLPYLQVYLDQLWREDYQRSYAGKTPEEPFPHLEITRKEIEDFGEIKDVLQKFLTERKSIIGAELDRKFPELDDDFLSRVLNEFVSDFGTKLPLVYKVIDDNYYFPEITRKFFEGFHMPALQFAINELEKNMILRKDGQVIELAHDILAKLIDEQRDAKQRKRIRIRTSIRNYLKEKDAGISLNEIKEWDSEVAHCGLTDEELKFYTRWREVRMQEEEERISNERVQSAIEHQKELYHKRRVKTIYRLLVAALFVIAVMGYVISRWVVLSKRTYATSFVNYEVKKIEDKRDALRLACYIYSQMKSSPLRDKLQESIIDLAKNPGIQNTQSMFNLKLASSKEYFTRADFDISPDSRYLAVQSDSSVRDEPFLLSVYEIGNGSRRINQFRNIFYAYFIDNLPHLLFMATSDSLSRGNFFPDKFLLYDCQMNQVVKEFSFRKMGMPYVLYNKAFIVQNRYSAYDSYDVRVTANGNYLIPCLNIMNYENPYHYIFLSRNGDSVLKDESVYFSISISPDYRYLMTGGRSNSGVLTLYAYNQFGNRIDEIRDVEWADFTAGNSILFAAGEYVMHKHLNAGPTLPDTIPLKGEIDFATASESGYVVIATTDSNTYTTHLSNKPHAPASYREHLVGLNRKGSDLVTLPVGRVAGCGYDSVLRKRNLANGSFVDLVLPGCIGRAIYDPGSNRILVQTDPVRENEKPLLYVIDTSFSVLTSFDVSPNDSYCFSKDGNKLVLVRDDVLNIYALNKALVNFSNFEEVMNWANLKDRAATDGLLAKYKVHLPNFFSIITMQ